MKALYHKSTLIDKLYQTFSSIFTNETAPTREHLIDFLMSVISLNGFQSVLFNYDHFIRDISDFKLNSYYYALRNLKEKT